MWIDIKGRVVNFRKVEYFEYIGNDFYLYYQDGKVHKFGNIKQEEVDKINELLEVKKGVNCDY